jgi:hypothetical protein
VLSRSCAVRASSVPDEMKAIDLDLRRATIRSLQAVEADA